MTALRSFDAQPPRSAIDLSELRVVFEGEPDELAAFCTDVASAMEGVVAQLATAMRNRDWLATRAKAHELRGLAGNVGARGFAALCASYENPVAEPGAPNYGVRAIADEMATVCDALREVPDLRRADAETERR